MWRLIKTWPFTIWLGLAIVLRGILAVWQPEYDSGNLGALLVLTSAIWGFPIYLPLEAGLLPLIAVPLSALACVTIDYVIRRVRMRTTPPGQSQDQR